MESEFRVGADVVCSDGPAGKLRHLVLDPDTKSVTHIVVDSQPHFGVAVLTPREQVAMAGNDEIRLRCSRDELKRMDPFEELMYSPAEGAVGTGRLIPAPYDSPGGGLGLMPMAGLGGPLGAPPIMEEVVPSGEVVIDPDSTVEARDGEVGHVEEVLTDPATGKISHLIIRRGHLWARRHVRLPASAVTAVEEGVVRLGLTTAEVAALADGHDADSPATAAAAAPATVEVHRGAP